MWNHWEEVSASLRTTNNLESFHSRLNDKTGRSHPNIYQAVGILQKEQSIAEATIQQMQAGMEVSPPKKKKYLNLNNRLNNLKGHLNNGHIDIITYARAVSHLFSVNY